MYEKQSGKFKNDEKGVFSGLVFVSLKVKRGEQLLGTGTSKTHQRTINLGHAV